MTDHEALTEAVDYFLWMTSYTQKKEKIVSAWFTTLDSPNCQQGTDNWEMLANNLKKYRHPDSVQRRNKA